MAERHFSLSDNWWCGTRTSLHLHLGNTIIGTHNKQTTFNWPNISDLYKELMVWEIRYNHCAFVQDRAPGEKKKQPKQWEPVWVLYSKCKIPHQTKKGINLPLWQGEKVRGEVECFIWKEEWFGNHPAQTHSSCLCLAEGGPFSHGVRVWQGSAWAEGSSLGTRKYCGCPGWQATALLQGGRVSSISRDCGKPLRHSFCPCSLLYWLNSCRKKIRRNQMEKCRKLIKMSHSLPFSFLKDWEASTQAGCKKMCNVRCITLSRNQCGRVPFPSVRILIFLRGAISAISIMKLSSWPRSNLEKLKDRGGFAFVLQQHCPLIPCACCNSHLANNLKLKVYE